MQDADYGWKCIIYMERCESCFRRLHKNSHLFEILVTSRPKIKNRRKYPRMDISNKCKIFVEETGKEIDGQLDNISGKWFCIAHERVLF